MNVSAAQLFNSSSKTWQQLHQNKNDSISTEKKGSFFKHLSSSFSSPVISNISLIALLIFAGTSAFLSPPVISFTAVVVTALCFVFVAHQLWLRIYDHISKFYQLQTLVTELIEKDLTAPVLSGDQPQPRADQSYYPGIFLRQSAMWKRSSPWAIKIDEAEEDQPIGDQIKIDRTKPIRIVFSAASSSNCSQIYLDTSEQLLSKQEELSEVQKLLKFNHQTAEAKIKRNKERFVHLKSKLDLGSWILGSGSLVGKMIDKSQLLLLLLGGTLAAFSKIADAVGFSKDIFGIFHKVLLMGKMRLCSIEILDLKKKLFWMEEQKQKLHNRIIQQPHTVEEHYRAHLRYCALEQSIDDIRLQIEQHKSKNSQESRRLWRDVIELTIEAAKDTLAFIRNFKRFQTRSAPVITFCRIVDGFNFIAACSDLLIHCYKFVDNIKQIKGCLRLIVHSQKLKKYGEPGSIGDAHIHYVLHLKKAYLMNLLKRRLFKVIERCVKIGVSVAAIILAAKVLLLFLGISIGGFGLSVVGAISTAFVLLALFFSCLKLANKLFSKRHEIAFAITSFASYKRAYTLTQKRDQMILKLYHREKEGMKFEERQEELCKVQEVNQRCKKLYHKLSQAEEHSAIRKMEAQFYHKNRKTAKICHNVLAEALSDEQSYLEFVNNLRSLGIIVVGKLTMSQLLKKIASSEWETKKIEEDLAAICLG